jgi:hypothetical protein
MIKKPSESRIRTARASMRMHEDLRAAVDFMAKAERRTVSQWLEMTVLDRVTRALENRFNDDGSRPQRETHYPLRFKRGNEPIPTKR